MSRNEMVLLLACAFAAAILSSGPAPLLHSAPITISSLFSPEGPGTVVADTAAPQPDLDHP